jgi:hypothetical protein
MLMLTLAACALVLSMGCSISASLESSSTIISSPFESMSASSEGEEEVAFLEETQSYTSAFVAAGSVDKGAFQKGVSDIAARRGISDWEANPATWNSIGRGMAQADLNQGQVEDYAQSLAGGNEQVAALLMQGFAGAN